MSCIGKREKVGRADQLWNDFFEINPYTAIDMNSITDLLMYIWQI
jgi:hypothetical protein